MRFHTILKLGPNREQTKEGFTLFRNVSISRVGWQVYGADELPGIEPDKEGLVRIYRDPAEVFRPETLASCNGKSLVIEHPEDDVKPENWRQLTNGFMFDARRGTGEQKDDCVADILVTTPEALAEIDADMRQVSLGYDADYYVLGPGRAEQRNLIVNHVALVPAGRCGPRCAIRDHATISAEETAMKFWDQIMAALAAKDTESAARIIVKARDAEEEEEAERKKKDKEESEAKDKARDKSIADGLKAINDSMPKLVTDAVRDCMKEMKDAESEEKEKKDKEEKEAKDKARDDEEEKEVKEEAGDKAKDHAGKFTDSAVLEDQFNAVKSAAEIVAPGISFPTFDRAADPRKTVKDCICALRQRALVQGLGDATTAGFIKTVSGKAVDEAGLKALRCGDTRALFNGVVALKKQHNGTAIMGAAVVAKTGDQKTPLEKFMDASNAMRNPGKK